MFKLLCVVLAAGVISCAEREVYPVSPVPAGKSLADTEIEYPTKAQVLTILKKVRHVTIPTTLSQDTTEVTVSLGDTEFRKCLGEYEGAAASDTIYALSCSDTETGVRLANARHISTWNSYTKDYEIDPVGALLTSKSDSTIMATLFPRPTIDESYQYWHHRAWWNDPPPDVTSDANDSGGQSDNSSSPPSSTGGDPNIQGYQSPGTYEGIDCTIAANSNHPDCQSAWSVGDCQDPDGNPIGCPGPDTANDGGSACNGGEDPDCNTDF